MEVIGYLIVVVILGYLFTVGVISRLRQCTHNFDKQLERREMTEGKLPDGRDRVTAIIYLKECSKCGEIRHFKVHKDEIKS